MTDRADEHRQVAARMSRQFTMAEFKRLYRQMFPDRPVNSIMPYRVFPPAHPDREARTEVPEVPRSWPVREDGVMIRTEPDAPDRCGDTPPHAPPRMCGR